MAGWFATSGDLATAGQTHTMDIGNAAIMGSNAADHLAIANLDTTGTILVSFSTDGSNYTTGIYTVASNITVEFRDCSVMKVKLDGSANNVQYSLAAWRSGAIQR
jgi:hypothetical protein